MYRLPIGNYVEHIVDWMTTNLVGFFSGIKIGLQAVINAFSWVFTTIPFFIMIILLALLAWRFASRGAAIFTVIGLLIVNSIQLWQETMQTLALVTTSTLIALIIGVPLGILMSRSDRACNIIRPILDFMQTMPAFVYLIPAVYFFDLGVVPGCVATIIFAMPPAVRLTNLGIRQVPHDVIEASRSYGATGRQMLIKTEIPLAMPTILTGLNQTIMLALSMVVISSMIGANGLGVIVLKGIAQLQIGTGFEGGLAVVILAMVLDRITQGLGKKKDRKSILSFLTSRKKQDKA